MSNKNKLKEVVHKECGNVAFLCEDREYILHEQVAEGMLFHRDGTLMKNGEPIKCESCGNKVWVDLINGELIAI